VLLLIKNNQIASQATRLFLKKKPLVFRPHLAMGLALSREKILSIGQPGKKVARMYFIWRLELHTFGMLKDYPKNHG